MPLHIVATPIGNDEDLSARAVRLLRLCPIIIGEEYREVTSLLKKISAGPKQIELLNEHSTETDVKRLVELVRNQEAALVSDCGTPAFCDPGANLVRIARQEGIKIHSVPGPSSLAAFMSISGVRLDHFLFRGFLPANREERVRELKALQAEPKAIILLDTPYRLGRLLDDIAQNMPDRIVTVGMNLSQMDEAVFTGPAGKLNGILKDKKGEFLLLLHATNKPASVRNSRPRNYGSRDRKKSRRK